jgi:hypothetical protein
MKTLYALIIGTLLPALVIGQTTNTNCTQIGDQVNCTSTTNNSAEQNAEASRHAGEQIGSALGLMMARHDQIKNYCKYHPGEQWHTDDWSRAGTCKISKAEKQAQLNRAMSSQYPVGSPKWCALQAKGSSYVGIDGVGRYCTP